MLSLLALLPVQYLLSIACWFWFVFLFLCSDSGGRSYVWGLFWLWLWGCCCCLLFRCFALLDVVVILHRYVNLALLVLLLLVHVAKAQQDRLMAWGSSGQVGILADRTVSSGWGAISGLVYLATSGLNDHCNRSCVKRRLHFPNYCRDHNYSGSGITFSGINF